MPTIRHALLVGFALGLASCIDFARADPGTKLQELQGMGATLYNGTRASRLLAAQVRSKDGKSLGQVRNIVVGSSGKIEALISEQAGTGLKAEFVVRFPWSLVGTVLDNGVITIDLAKSKPEDFSLFPEQTDKAEPFHITAVIGDYVRLQTGRGYGYVSDVVFSRDGVMSFIVVTREEFAGGGTFAFPYPGETGLWNAQLSYYGLPFITEDQANAAAIPFEAGKFLSNK